MTQRTANLNINLEYLIDNNGLTIVSRWFIHVAVTITKWRTNKRTRKALLKLNATQLDDIGLSVAQAQAEGRRPFWQG